MDAPVNVAPTIDPQGAAARTWDVLIVGAGPAGASAAVQCARRGLATLVVDKCSFPRWKVCGCCLNARSMSLLELLGATDVVRQRGAVPLHRLLIGVRGRTVELPLRGGFAVSREVLDAALIAAATRAGADFLPQATAESTMLAGDHRCVRIKCEGQLVDVRARLVLAADGLGGALMSGGGAESRIVRPHSRIGAGAMLAEGGGGYTPGVVFMAVARSGYVGAVRVEGDRCALAAALDAKFVRACGGLGPAAGEVIRSAGLGGADDAASLAWKGTPALTRRSAVAAERLFALGDAACFVEPFTGEGMAWALTCGVNVADLAAQAVRSWHPCLAAQWAAHHRRLVGRRQCICRWTAALLRQPAVHGLAARVLSAWPGALAPVLRYVDRVEQGPFVIRNS